LVLPLNLETLGNKILYSGFPWPQDWGCSVSTLGGALPTYKVNLDALITREDFESTVGGQDTSGVSPFKAGELRRGATLFNLFRKPDFQRVTHYWEPATIVELVESFLDGELIPPIIVWQSPTTNKVFIIDGVHRVSALIAWVNDDYGDGDLSEKFWKKRIHPTQQRLAETTRTLMKQRVGTYAKLQEYGENPDRAPDENTLKRARAVGFRALRVEQVLGDAAIAERSFLRINGNAAPIDETEFDVIRARKKPNTIAARAIISAGTGHKFWRKFSPARIEEIEKLAAETYGLLFGDIVGIRADSPDVPRGGEAYSKQGAELVLDVVNRCNGITPAMWQDSGKKRKKTSQVEVLADDLDGSATVRFLETVRRMAMMVSSREYIGSLGLDPVVYSYGATGQFHSGALLACLRFANELHDEKQLPEFTKIRFAFEEFLVQHKGFINQIAHAKGSRTRPVESFLCMYHVLLNTLREGERDNGRIIEALHAEESLKELHDDLIAIDSTVRKRHSKGVEAAGVIRALVDNRERCPVCKARIPPFVRSKDHTERMVDGGTGTLDNLRFTHPYCNSYSNEMKAREKKADV
jgi:hypothetical protein